MADGTKPTIGIVGAGTMGAGIAQIAAAQGHGVLLYDARHEAAGAAVGGVGQMYRKLAEKGKMAAEEAAAASARLKPCAALADLAGAEVVVEAVVEDLGVKRSLWIEVEKLVSPRCLLATNTSSLSITSIAAGLGSPQRLVGMHFFNPAPLMELVEIVAGVASAESALAGAEALARSWGKRTVRARSTPGFIVNRVARPFYGEGLRLLAEGAASAATLDAVLRECGGFRMGPLELTDLIGQDVNFAVTSAVFAGFFFDPRFTPSLVQREMVEAGWLGRKSGRGFYRYGAGATNEAPAAEAAAPAPREVAGGGFPPALRERLERAGVAVTAGTAAVAVDLALDYGTTPRLAVSRVPGSAEAGYRETVGALQAAGLAVSPVRNFPGLVVLRTVAMLANEAADAVHFGVATAEDVDLAMVKGLNYPIGPLAWADRLGIEIIHNTLAALGRFYGEDRYRISPLIQRLYAERERDGGRFHV